MIEKLIHKPTGELVADNPWSVPGTRVELVLTTGARQAGDQGAITERCVELTRRLQRIGGNYSRSQYIQWDSRDESRGYGPTHIERSRLKIIP